MFPLSDNMLHSFLSKRQQISRLAVQNTPYKRLNVIPAYGGWTRRTDTSGAHAVLWSAAFNAVTSAVCRRAPAWDRRINHFTSEAPKFSPLLLGFRQEVTWYPRWRQNNHKRPRWQEAAGLTGKVTEGKHTAWERTDSENHHFLHCWVTLHLFLVSDAIRTNREEKDEQVLRR